ncbi:MAG: DUF2062 domain-containing protein [Phycisphaerae bacterium]
MPHRAIYRRIKDFVIFRVLHANDTPHRIALGMAIGIFVTWTPTIGFQMLITLGLCLLFRANKAVGVPVVWISNPFTVIPIYGTNYALGCVLTGRKIGKFDVIESAMKTSGGWWDKAVAWAERTWDIALPLWVGSVVIGLILSTGMYFLTYYSVLAYRSQRRAKHPELYEDGEILGPLFHPTPASSAGLNMQPRMGKKNLPPASQDH